MNLGENIYKLRTQHNLSQGDLAEQLEVSRQSVSKWENNSAVPELDKLMKLAQIFGITIDELVTGTEAKAATPLSTQPPTQQQSTAKEQKSYSPGTMLLGFPMLLIGIVLFVAINTFGPPLFACLIGFPFMFAGIFMMALGLGAYYTEDKAASGKAISQSQKTVGIVLSVAGVAVFLVIALFAGLLMGLLYAAPLYVPGLICLLAKKHAGLKCAWAEFFLVVTYFSFATGTSWNSFWTYLKLLLFSDVAAADRYHPVALYLSLAMWLVYAILIIWTVCSYRYEVRPLRKRDIIWVIVGAVLYFGLPVALIQLHELVPIRLLSLLNIAVSWLKTALLTVLLVHLWPTARNWVEHH